MTSPLVEVVISGNPTSYIEAVNSSAAVTEEAVGRLDTAAAGMTTSLDSSSTSAEALSGSLDSAGAAADRTASQMATATDGMAAGLDRTGASAEELAGTFDESTTTMAGGIDRLFTMTDILDEDLKKIAGTVTATSADWDDATLNMQVGIDKVIESTQKVIDSTEEMGGAIDDSAESSSAGLETVSGMLDRLAGKFGIVGEAAEAMGGAIDKSTAGADAGLDSTATSVGGIGIAAKAGVAAAVVLAGAAVDMGMKYQELTTNIAAWGSVSVAQAGKITGAFLDTAGSTIYSAQDIAKAYGGVVGQLTAVQGHALNSSQAMTVMRASMDLAEGSGEDLGTATSALSKVMQTYGIKSDGAAKASDALFSTAKGAGVSLGQVAQSVQQVHTQLGGLTPPLGQTGALLVDMVEHGMNGSRAMRVLGTALNSLLKPNETVIEDQKKLKIATDALPPSLQHLADEYTHNKITSMQAQTAAQNLGTQQAQLWTQFTSADSAVSSSTLALKESGDSALFVHGKFVGLGAAVGILHNQTKGMTEQQQLAKLSQDGLASSAAKLLPIIDAGSSAFDKAAKEVNKSGAAQEAAKKQAATFQHQLELVKVAVEDWVTNLGTKLIPILQKVMAVISVVAPVIGHVLVDAIKDVVHVIKTIVDAFIDVVDWFKKASIPALVLAGVLTAVLGPAIVSLAATAIASFVSMAASAVAEVASMIAAQGVAIAGYAIMAGEYILNAAKMAVGAVTSFGTMIAAGASWVVEQGAQLAESAANGVVWLGEHAVMAAGYIAENIAMAASATAAFIAENAATLGIVAGIVALIAVIVLIATHWKQVWGEIKRVADDAWHFLDGIIHKIIGAFSTAGHWLLDAGKAVVHGFILGFEYLTPQGLIIKFHTQIIHGFEAAIHWLLDAGKAVIQGLWNGIKSVASLINNVGYQVKHWILSGLNDALHWLEGIGKDILTGLWNGIKEVASIINNVGYQIKHWVLSGLKDAIHWLSDIGKDIIKGLVNGIKDMAEAPAKAVRDAAHAVIGVAKSVLSIFSPSKVFADMGKSTMQGLAQGIHENKALALAEMKSLEITKTLQQEFHQLIVTARQMGSVIGTVGAVLTVTNVRLREAGTSVRVLVTGLMQLRTAFHDVQSSGLDFGTELDTIPDELSTVTASVDNLAGELQGTLTSALNTTNSTLQTVMSTFTGGAVSAINKLSSAIGTLASKWNGAWSAIQAKSTAASHGIIGTMTNIRTGGFNALQWAVAAFQSVWNTTWSTIASDMVNAFPNPSGMLTPIGQDLVNGLVSGVNSEIGEVTQAGLNIADGLSAGISQGAASVATAAANAATAAAAAAKAATKSHSPSQVMHDIGMDMMRGLANGLGAGGSLVLAIAKQQIAYLVHQINEDINHVGGAAIGANIGIGATGSGTTGRPTPVGPVTIDLNIDGQRFAQAILNDLQSQVLRNQKTGGRLTINLT